ncbi:hypothetical protein ACP4OV_018564 [Aristida adscensionis]
MAIAAGEGHPPLPLAAASRHRRGAGRGRATMVLAAAAVVLAACPHAALAASGGAMGGRSYSDYSSSSSSSSSSSYSDYSSSRRYSSSSTPAEPITGVELCYLAAAVAVAVALIIAVQHCTRSRTTVVKLQVALLGSAKSFQTDLNDIANKLGGSNQRWYKFMLTETLCSLRRHKNCCISSSLLVDVKDKVDSWEQSFDEISIGERSKFDEETLYNLEGIKRKKAYSKKSDDFRNEYIAIDVKDEVESSEQHLEKNSVDDERSELDEETIHNLEGIQRNKAYSRKPDGSRNEYIVITILVAADGVLDFPEVRDHAGLEAVVETLNSIPARRIQGIHVLWTPQDENDVLSEAKLLEDYPHLKPLYDD